MNARDLTLNIAVNLGRLSTYAIEKKEQRLKQFLKDTDYYVEQLKNTPKTDKFLPTYLNFMKKFQELKNNIRLDEDWAEDTLTWANILIHRAKLA